MPKFCRSSYTYTRLFCEENIWKLIRSLYTNQLAKPIDVLFILNQKQSIALFEQHLSTYNNPVIWDYHVVLTAQINNTIVVFDFDSQCDFPQNIKNYFALTFPQKIELHADFIPYIKSINAAYYLECFYSDRKHMQGLIEQHQYPNYKTITPENNDLRLTLKQCRDTKQALNLSYYANINQLLLPDDYLNVTKSICIK